MKTHACSGKHRKDSFPCSFLWRIKTMFVFARLFSASGSDKSQCQFCIYLMSERERERERKRERERTGGEREREREREMRAIFFFCFANLISTSLHATLIWRHCEKHDGFGLFGEKTLMDAHIN